MTKRLSFATLLPALLLSANLCAFAASAPTATGTWKVVGDVQGVPVLLTCIITDTDHKLTGSCTDSDGKAHAITGISKDLAVGWNFDTDYQGTPINVALTGTVDATGSKMSGSIDVSPMAVDGTFTATLQPAAPATAAAPAAAPTK